MTVSVAERVAIGQIVAGRYAILRQLGRGGGGSVWLAEDLRRDRRLVAFKCVAPGDTTRARAESLKQEFRVLTRLRHPHLMRVFDIGTLDSGLRYLTGEYVDGETLDKRVDPLSGGDLELLLAQLLLALEYLERKEVLHRDIKPSNIMVQWRVEDAAGTLAPVAKLVDFGLATSTRVSDPGLGGGTRHFMAPELLLGRSADAISELFGVAAAIYTVIVGSAPFVGQLDDASNLLHLEPASFDDFPKDIPLGVRGVLRRMLAVSRQGRYPNAREALEDLIFRSDGRLTDERLRLDTEHVEDGSLVARVELLDEWQAVQGRGESIRWVLVGPNGYGKGRLAREFEIQAQLMEHPTIRVEVSPGGKPYLVPLSIISQFEQGRQTRSVTPRSEVPGGNARRRGSLFSSFYTAFEPMLLERLAAINAVDKPAMVIVEDIDLADAWSLKCLSGWFASQSRFSFVATAQTMPAALMESAEQRALRPMDRAEIAAFLKDQLGDFHIPPRLLNKIIEQSGGVPDDLRSICAQMVRDTGVRGVRTGTYRAFSMPEDLDRSAEGAFEEHLAVLGTAGLRIVETLSLFQRPMSAALIGDVLLRLDLSQGPGQRSRGATYLKGLLIELDRRGCLRLDQTVEQTTVRPPSARWQKIVRARMTADAQRKVHQALGETLAAEWPGKGEVDARRVAFHLQRGVNKSLARTFEMIAAVEALKVGAIERALGHLRWAMRTRHHGPEGAYVRLCEGMLCARIGETLNAHGAYVEASRLGQGTYVGVLARLQMARLALDMGRKKKARSALDDALRRWPTLSDSFTVEHLRGRFALSEMRFDDANRAFEVCIARARRDGWCEGAWDAMMARAESLLLQGDVAASKAQLDALRVIESSDLGDSDLVGRLRLLDGVQGFIEGEDKGVVERNLSASLALFNECGDQARLVQTRVLLASFYIATDAPRLAREQVSLAIELRRKSPRQGSQIVLSSLHHLARLMQGEAVQPVVETLRALYRQALVSGRGKHVAQTGMVLSWALLTVGSEKEGMALLDQIEAGVVARTGGEHLVIHFVGWIRARFAPVS